MSQKIKTKIHIAHSPDSDDAFMFYAINTGQIDTKNYDFIDVLADIETLNQKAHQGTYEVTAISVHTYPYIADQYAILSSGASMGDNYGPMLVAKNPFQLKDLSDKIIAVPGTLTSAFLALKLYQPTFQYKVIPFDQIVGAVLANEVDAGLIIHESQLTYQQEGLQCLLDLGKWWFETTHGLPLPLGCNVIRKDLGEETAYDISCILRESIQYSLSHRQEAVDYALKFARGMDIPKADKFIGMYVNDLTLHYGHRGQEAMQLFLQKAFDNNLIPALPTLDFI